MSDWSKKVTVILPLRRRDEYTWRWMAYARHIRAPYPILIADGGDNPEVEARLLDGSKYPELHYRYLRFPFDCDYAHYYQKVLQTLEQVETPYVCRSDNDDFYLTDGLLKSVEFLDQNPDYAICRGRLGGFSIGCKAGEAQPLYASNAEFNYFEPVVALEQATALERIAFQGGNYVQTYYGVHRREEMIRLYRTLVALNFDDLWMAELFMGMWTVASGKIKLLDDVYYVRQGDAPGSSARESWSKSEPLSRMLSETWSDDFYGMLRAVGEVVMDRDGIPMTIAVEKVRSAFRDHYAKWLWGSLRARFIKKPKKSVLRQRWDRLMPSRPPKVSPMLLEQVAPIRVFLSQAP